MIKYQGWSCGSSGERKAVQNKKRTHVYSIEGGSKARSGTSATSAEHLARTQQQARGCLLCDVHAQEQQAAQATARNVAESLLFRNGGGVCYERYQRLCLHRWPVSLNKLTSWFRKRW